MVRALQLGRRVAAVAALMVGVFLSTRTASAQLAHRIALRPADAVAEAEFSRVTSVRELGDGSLLVADPGDVRLLHVRWGRGELTAIGRVGSGPGEYRAIGRLYPLAGDSTLFTDPYLSRWSLMDGPRIVGTVSDQHGLHRLLQGQLSGADEFGHVLGIRGVVFSGRGSPRLRSTADSLGLLLVERGSAHVDTLARLKGPGSAGFHVSQPAGGQPGRIVGGNPLGSQDQALLFRDGWIAVAWIEPYRVDWRAPNGSWIRGVALPFPRVRVSNREKCFAMQRWFGRADPCDPSSLPGWPEMFPPFLPTRLQGSGPASALLAAPDGGLVIARTPSAASPQHQYDVVDRTGQLIGVTYLGLNETVIGFGARSVYVLATDDLGVQTLRRHPWP